MENNKNGHWVMRTSFDVTYAACSECGREALGTVDINDNFKQVLTPFCPYCGLPLNGADLIERVNKDA